MQVAKTRHANRLAQALLASALFALPMGGPGLSVFAQTPAPADSGAPTRDPFLAPPPAPVPKGDSGSVGAPLQEAVKLSTQGAFTNPSPRVGDSLDYVLQVEWQDTQVPVFVL